MAKRSETATASGRPPGPLSSVHKWPHRPSRPLEGGSDLGPGVVELSEGGTFLHLRGSPRPSGNRAPGVRGRIAGFSASSRRNFVHQLESVDWSSALGRNRRDWFATLTVHEDQGVTHAKLALRRLRKRLLRAAPSTLAAWKLEPQKRGAPHFHLILAVDLQEMSDLVGGCAPRSEDEVDSCPVDLVRWRFEDWLLEVWREVTRQPSITRVSVEEPRSSGGLRRYMTKYMAKGHAVPPDWVGARYWGFWGEWPRSTVVGVLHGRARWRFRRILRGWIRARARAARAARRQVGSGRTPWRDAYGGMRVCVPAAVSLPALLSVGVQVLGVRDGPPTCLT